MTTPSPATRLVGGGRPERAPGASLSVPVEFTSTYVADGAVNYARVGNPTWTAFEDVLGDLEGGQALAFASGMAAVSAVLHLTGVGAPVVVPDAAYNGTLALAQEWAAAGRIELRPVPMADTDAVCAALDGAGLCWLETPTNPMLAVADLTAIAARARALGVRTACDNTFLTPLLQRPLEHGVDIVVHSATKYLAGHSDVLLGATVSADPEITAALHTRRTLLGAIPGPMETWLALRGMRTLHLRVERAGANAAELARRLADHPQVARVRYPGVGAIVSLEPTGGVAAATRVEQRVRVWTPATSLGGVESTLERRRRHPLEPTLVPEHLVRLSVGVEDVEDLWADLDRALRD